MLDYISWYIIELRSRLLPHLPGANIAEITKEAESHLRENTRELKERLQLSDEAAALAAIDAFGKPEPVALGYLRRANPRILGIKPLWLVIISTLVAIYCFDYPWLTMRGPFDNLGESWPLTVALLAGIGSLILLVTAVSRSFRSYRWPVLATCVATCLALPPVLFSWMIISPEGWQGISRFHLSRDEATLRLTVQRMDKLEAYYLRAQKAYAVAQKPSDLAPEFRSPSAAMIALGFMDSGEYTTPRGFASVKSNDTVEHFLLPLGGMAMVDGRIWGLGSTHVPLDLGAWQRALSLGQVSEFSIAKTQWAKQTPASLKTLREQRTSMRDLLVRVDEAHAGRIFFPNTYLLLSAEMPTLLFIPVLLLLDGITFAVVRRRRTWPGRALA